MKRSRGVIGFFVHHRVAANLVMLMMLLGGALLLSLAYRRTRQETS